MKKILKSQWHWSMAGILAGVSILAAMLLSKNLAIAGAFVALVRKILNIVNPDYLAGTSFIGEIRGSDTWMVSMLGGIMLGAFAASKLSGTFQLHGITAIWGRTFSGSVWKRAAVVFGGGILLGVGANIGGGCTTGAFLTGVPTLSVGSIVTSISFFAAAILTANFLYLRKDKTTGSLSYNED
ncbi:YeeE/YedE thiosulfate transporter family protein [Candidatus Magnetomonas plexicatena]|uniref:YeeE/YedE thiosulfate transporter family protein n=1 Tax=Candidatus Magnetomonas plexicatena TaxID=2552947 RepID=UPI0011016724|nr:YeeE/YedE family protein [Nitrospirales bacterium LBB_01]